MIKLFCPPAVQDMRAKVILETEHDLFLAQRAQERLNADVALLEARLARLKAEQEAQ
jgi:hypothetical protein